MPASGKTTISKVLAEKLEYPLLDVDEWMATHENMPVNEIIATKGKYYVLNLEADCLKSQDLRETIVSPPGSIIYTDCHSKLSSETLIVFINTPLFVVAERLAPDSKNNRGVIGLNEIGLEKLFNERQPLYKKWAHVVIDPKNLSEGQLADEIIRLYRG